MHQFKFFSLCLAAAGILLGAFSFARGSVHEDDLLDPSLDRPLPQYESTSVPGFNELPKVTLPEPVKLTPKVENIPAPSASPSPSPLKTPVSDRGSELAPNPLSSLLSGEKPQQQASPSDIQLEVPKTRPLLLDTKDKPSVIEKKRVDKPAQVATPPEYNSPFNPKRLAPKDSKVRSPSTKPSAKKTKTKSKQSKKKKAAPAPREPTLNYNIYRDQSAYPLDPRKPNNPCTQTQNCGCAGCLAGRPGLNGRPHQPREPGGYACGKNCSNKRPQFSAYWPRPLSALRDERDPESAAARYSGCQQSKLTDCFDRLANFRLIDYQRTDNGYCGPESDPYGCLGESKMVNSGYHVQSQPIEHAASYPMR